MRRSDGIFLHEISVLKLIMILDGERNDNSMEGKQGKIPDSVFKDSSLMEKWP